MKDLRDLRLDFRHYIADGAGAAGQAQAEMGEQLGGGRLGRRHHAQAQRGAAGSATHRHDHIDAFDGCDGFDQLTRYTPATARFLQHRLERRAGPNLDGTVHLPAGCERQTRKRAAGKSASSPASYLDRRVGGTPSAGALCES